MKVALVHDWLVTHRGGERVLDALCELYPAADLYTLAKSIAGGFPLSAVVGRAEVMDACSPGGLGGTYAGNPVACAAALAVLEVFDEERIFERAERLGERIGRSLDALAARHAEIVEVRRLGAMIALELGEDGDPNRPAAELTRKLTARVRRIGSVLRPAAARPPAVRPPACSRQPPDSGLRRPAAL